MVILGKMFVSESITEVEKFLNDTFGDDPRDKPCYVIFDTGYDCFDFTLSFISILMRNRCKLWKTILVYDKLFNRWKYTRFPVDRFHQSRSHKLSDLFCMDWCTMDSFEDLVGVINSR